MNSDGPYVCSQYSKLRPEVKDVKVLGLQWHFAVVLFFKLLFCISILIKFKCLYVVGVQKNLIYELPSVHTARTTEHHWSGQLVTTLLNKMVNSSHNLGCDELTV